MKNYFRSRLLYNTKNKRENKSVSDYKVSEIKNIAAPIAEKYGVRKISLFGSRARGDNNFNSDYDFLISKGKVNTLWLYMSLVDELERAFDSHVDVVNDTSADRILVSTAEREGIVLYEELGVRS